MLNLAKKYISMSCVQVGVSLTAIMWHTDDIQWLER